VATTQIVQQTISVRRGNDRRLEGGTKGTSEAVGDSLVFILENRCVRRCRYFAFARFCTTTREAVLDPSFEIKVDLSWCPRSAIGAKRLLERSRREVPVPRLTADTRRQLAGSG
jgi:hypothetical protein